MKGQTVMDSVTSSNDVGPAPCAWCATPTLHTFEVERPIYSTQKVMGKKRRVLTKPSITVPACRTCLDRLRNQP